MAKPNNSLANIKLPGENERRPIIPYKVSDGTNVATAPNMGGVDQELAYRNDLTSKLDKDNFGWVLTYSTYNNTYTYSVGDIVYYDGYIYECVTAVTTPEDFDYNKWTSRTVQYLIDNKGNFITLELENATETATGYI